MVLEVAHDALNRPAAAKVLNPDLARQPNAIAPRFLREAAGRGGCRARERGAHLARRHRGSSAPYIVMPLLKV